MTWKLLPASLALALSTPTLAQEPATKTPATVVVAYDQETVTPLIAEGVRNFESRAAVEANDPVRIASISKLIMALATLRLVDEGKIDLDADVSDYLGFKVRSPNFPDTPVTLAQLLSHRAGLRDKAQDGIDTVNGSAQEGGDDVKGDAGDAISWLDRAKQRINEATDQVKDAASEAKDDLTND